MPLDATDGPRLFRTLETHTGGEPLRIITEGFPQPPGSTILEKRAYARKHLDHLRRALMWEPRGHADMYGCLPVDPVTPDGDVGVLFLHNEGFSTMCGHGIIALVKVGLEQGLLRAVEGENRVRIDTPAGRVVATCTMHEGNAGPVTFENVPSFLLHREVPVDVPGIGSVSCDIGFGGAFYIYVDATQLGLEIVPAASRRLIEAGQAIQRAAEAQVAIVHPLGDPDLNFLYGTIFVGPPSTPGHHSSNACVFAEGELDRSPTGTGVSGRAAIHWAKGELPLGTPIEIASIIGSTFTVRALREVEVGAVRGIVPEVTGDAFLLGRSEFVLDPRDPWTHGFFLR